MFSAAAEGALARQTNLPGPSCTAKWTAWPASSLSHHGRACCDIARQWVLGMDLAQLGGAPPVTGPRWLRHRYPWGPSPWPLHWCEAVARKRLDCGAHAAIAHELFKARGIESWPAQFVQQFSGDATRHWSDKWAEEQIAAAWVDGDLIYHEGCALAGEEGAARLWDASAGWWIDPGQRGGYGALMAVRVLAPGQDAPLQWGGHNLRLNEWTVL